LRKNKGLGKEKVLLKIILSTKEEKEIKVDA